MTRSKGTELGGRAIGRRLPCRSGMILSAIGIGIAVCGLAVTGVLRLDGDASLRVPGVLPDWLATSGVRIIADTELSNPPLFFAGIGLTLLLIGAIQVVNAFTNREALPSSDEVLATAPRHDG